MFFCKTSVAGGDRNVGKLLATSCCIGPAIFVVFGTSVGFMGKLSIFEPYRPYFLTAAAAMLGFSFWKLYLKKPDCDCEEDVRVKKIARIILWIGTVYPRSVLQRGFKWIVVPFHTGDEEANAFSAA